MFKKYKLIGMVYKPDGSAKVIEMESSKDCEDAIAEFETKAAALYGKDYFGMVADVFVRGSKNKLVNITSRWK